MDNTNNVNDFEIATGSVRGAEHVRIDKPNQDSLLVHRQDNNIIGVVCDGNSSSEYSEVGSRIGARIICKNIKSWLEWAFNKDGEIAEEELSWFMDKLKGDIVGDINKVSSIMSFSPLSKKSNEKDILSDHFVFTSLFFIITNSVYIVAGVGDGTYIINDELKPIGDYPGNCPPGIVYALFPYLDSHMHEVAIHEFGPVSDLKNILIASDGADYITEKCLHNIPGKDEPVGEINQFLENDKYFKNPDSVRRKLTLMNRNTQKIDWGNKTIDKSTGLLYDDTTLIAVRRK